MYLGFCFKPAPSLTITGTLIVCVARRLPLGPAQLVKCPSEVLAFDLTLLASPAPGDYPGLTLPASPSTLSFSLFLLDDLVLTLSKAREAVREGKKGGWEEGKGRKEGRKGTLRREDSTLPSGGIPRRRVSLLFSSGHVSPWAMVSWLALCPAAPHRLSSGPSSGSHPVRSHWGHFKAAAMQAPSPDLSKDCVYPGAFFSFASLPSVTGEETREGERKRN